MLVIDARGLHDAAVVARGCRTAPRGRRPWRRHVRHRGSRRLRDRRRARPSARAWLNATCVGTPPGAARKNSRTASLGVRVMSQRSSASRHASPHARSAASRLSSPARSSSPRIAMMPPARCTSSICTSAHRRARPCTARHAARQPVDVGHGEIDLALMRGGEQMQHGVGRAAHGDVERHRVLERVEVGDAARQHACRRPARNSGWRDRRSGGRPRRTAACGRHGSPAPSRCRAATGPAPRSGSSSNWR